ncbi:hypothetical protein DTO164E3_2978 [Paecilomyces variotii]|nr:hypothetical protein DTO164E3_2978 [Paecilomyces variotii]KAJ9209108.1 hypothetical protein DTO032I3_325 [Paecilomyces variotii]KAJ9282988.1 hypothetical protein DTO021D3_325 [Paecilomyces variotii]KAJ9343809.1 hypothetical protein DTO027B6_3634 [Paecilomyces variotii]KAJ9386988.1 hypothetical protein DTO032I4_3432 [Paecilomyces variotii]
MPISPKWDLSGGKHTGLNPCLSFVVVSEIVNLAKQITTVPLPRWTQLSHRRLQSWPSALSKSNTLLASPLPTWLTQPIISPRFDELGIFADAPHGAPNHVLINEYRPGQGIMPHEDGAAYYPLVATVSLGAPIVLDVYEKQHRREGSDSPVPDPANGDDDDGQKEHNGASPQHYRILQEPRSLLITTKVMYTDYLHGIAETDRDENLTAQTVCNWDLLGDRQRYERGSYEREVRMSLTYRDVIKVAKLGNSGRFLGIR